MAGVMIAMLLWMAQACACVLMWKLCHVLFWNVRRLVRVQSFAMAASVTTVVALAVVALVHADVGAWLKLVACGGLIGIAVAEYEWDREAASLDSRR